MNANLIKLENNEAMKRAVARAKDSHFRALRVDFNTVTVGSVSAVYTVRVYAPKPGLLLALCNCEAGQRSLICKHQAAACVVPGTAICEALNQALSACEKRVTFEGATPKPAQPDHNCKLCFKPLKNSEHDIHTLCGLYESHSDEIAEFAEQVKTEREVYRMPSNQIRGEKYGGMDV